MKKYSLAVVKAINKSIAKWKQRCFTEDTNAGIPDCPLCLLFNTSGTPRVNKCKGCPIAEDTKQLFCIGTPYTEWQNNNTVSNSLAELEYLQILKVKITEINK